LVQTIAELFYEALKHEQPDAFARKKGNVYATISHAQLQALVEHLALAMREHGLSPGDSVAILSENRPEWAITDFACALSGLPSIPIYPTMTPSQTAFILKDSRAAWVICSNREQLSKVLHEWPNLPDLKAAVLLDGAPHDDHGHSILLWPDLLASGRQHEDRREEVRSWAAQRKPEDLLTIIYTSGTTGDPKGAMLSHGNLVSDMHAALRYFDLRPGERCLSVLPLSHIYERMGGHYTMFFSGVCIYYADSFLSLPQDLLEVRPHVLLAVPRIFEKVYSRVRDTAIAGGFFKRAVLGWTLHVGHYVARYRFLNQQPPWWVRLPAFVANLLVYRKVRARTGGRIRLAISGGAPLNRKVNEFFWAMGISIFEGYGLTETSPIIAVSRPGHARPGYVGQPIWETWEGAPFMKLGEDGEILVKGPNVMQGYWRNEQATQEVFDDEGYFHTGDIGELDDEGRLKITDRKKEILVTSGGKNVAPQPIENLLRADKYIEQVVLIGDHRNFISAILVPHFPTLQHWAKHKHLLFANDPELVMLPEVKAKLMRQVEHVNAKLSKYERVRRIIILDREMTADSGLLTPSLKVKRRVVAEKFKDRIDAVYAGSTVELH
jgi:long-chain acyl-CoA synthetase